MRPLFKKDVNKKYSPTWILCNDNSKSKTYRAIFLERFGGRFDKTGPYYVWKSRILKEHYVPKTKTVRVFNRTGEILVIQNIKKYCRDNKMSRAAFGEMLKGTRKSYKGFRPVPEDYLLNDIVSDNIKNEDQVLTDSQNTPEI